MVELYAVLLSWAVTLSGYPAPARAPEVVKVPHSFFVKNACGGHECKVWGWFAGGTKLYIDDRMDPEGNTLAASVLVHEMVHYLQAVDRGDDILSDGAAFGILPTCKQTVQWELQAYGVQKEFLLRYGVYTPVGISMLRVGCGDP